jgi:SPP1 family predicted phage head-tail adaptor
MQIGQLNKQITLYTASTTTLSSGQKQVSFTEEITVFANVEYMGGGESYEADQKVADNRVVFTIHNTITDLSKQRKVVYDSEDYEVTRIYPVEDDYFLKIEARVRDNSNVGI